MLKNYISKVESGQNLTQLEAEDCLKSIFSGSAEESDIIDLLDALANKGESIEEITGFAKVLTENMIKVEGLSSAVDTCGTGGSGLDRFNVGTAMAFVLAAGGYPVAKHGNRGSKRANGSFDLLEALDIYFETTAAEETMLFGKNNLVFLYARTHHPVMKFVGPARAKLGKRTIFNIVGPLCNPGLINKQVVGVSDLHLGEKLIQVLKNLGRKKAIVVYGEPGIDEFSVSGESTFWTLTQDGSIKKQHFDPKVIGLQTHAFNEIPGGDAEINKELFNQMINGDSCNGLLDMVALNAGAALCVLDAAHSVAEGYNTAKELILSGSVKELVEKYRLNANEFRK